MYNYYPPLDVEVLEIFRTETEKDRLLTHYHTVLLIAEDDSSVTYEEAFERYFQTRPELAPLRPKLYDLMFPP